MPKTRVNCPNCRQPIVADVKQLFDVGVDPSAKQQLLSGSFNLVRCPFCGYQGTLAMPIVYHDPQKEILLTYLPSELGLPRDEQERVIGGMINQVVNNLPQQKRKAYLLQPKAQLTMQGLVERILESDGITREMIQAQQKRLNLLQRLLSISDVGARQEVVKHEEGLIDTDFFNLISRLQESALAGGDEGSARRLEELNMELLENTELGHQILKQTQEIQAAIKSLQEVGKELTREKLLEIVMKAPNETRLQALVSLARPGMDYAFFQMLSEKIDRARDKGRQRLIDLRESLLESTRQFDKQMAARATAARQLLEQILQSEDISQATMQNLPLIDELFLQALNQEMDAARKSGDLEKMGELQKVLNVVQQASAPPSGIALIEELLDAHDEQVRRQILEEHQEEVTPDFIQMLTGLLAQVEQSDENKELAERLQAVTRQARRFSMKLNLRGGGA